MDVSGGGPGFKKGRNCPEAWCPAGAECSRMPMVVATRKETSGMARGDEAQGQVAGALGGALRDTLEARKAHLKERRLHLTVSGEDDLLARRKVNARGGSQEATEQG